MKKYILLGCAAIAAVMLIVFGPAFLNLYRLQNYVTSSNEVDMADGGPWPRVSDTCVGCHGTNGNSLNQRYPSLAGQPTSYLVAQLQNFSNGRRANPNMAPLAMTMSEAEIQSLAKHFAKQQPVKNRFFKPDPDSQTKGKRLVEAGGCAACHGNEMLGQEQFPRLAGQGYDYILVQLDAFAIGTRIDPSGTMKPIAEAASLADRKAMASYLASLSPERK